jgi:hypothetical protein
MRLSFALLMFLSFVGGCAHYEYDLITPPELARHVAAKADTIVTIDPLEYRLQTVDNHLVVRIFNTTDDTMQLLGDKSSVVDPEGQSHPLRPGPIAPHSFLKLILPPPRPQVYDSGPTFGIGVGVHASHNDDPDRHYRGAYGVYDPALDPPRYMYVYDEGNAYFWDWHGDGDARLTLVYQTSHKDLIHHEFTFRRRKM